MPVASEKLNCPLCTTISQAAFLESAARRFFRCAECDLVFVHPDDRPEAEDEAKRYLAHENRRDDDGYANFLRRLADPVCARMPAGSRGLDVGCGPTPVLAELLTASGRPTEYYDPLFFPRPELLRATYDFVTCTEVVEHAHDPAALFAQLVGLTPPGGTIAVMTSLHDSRTDFGTWWYARDITHVCFFSERTMTWLGDRFALRMEFVGANVVLLGT